MARIVIEVDDATAKKWHGFSPKIKACLQESFAKQIAIVSQGTTEHDFESLLNKAREEAARNGLTEERLQELLNEE